MNDSPLIKGCGIWERVSKAGKRYMTGRLGPLRVVIFENSKRGQENEPDWVLHLGESAPWKPEQQKQPARAQEPEEALL